MTNEQVTESVGVLKGLLNNDEGTKFIVEVLTAEGVKTLEATFKHAGDVYRKYQIGETVKIEYTNNTETGYILTAVSKVSEVSEIAKHRAASNVFSLQIADEMYTVSSVLVDRTLIQETETLQLFNGERLILEVEAKAETVTFLLDLMNTNRKKGTPTFLQEIEYVVAVAKGKIDLYNTVNLHRYRSEDIDHLTCVEMSFTITSTPDERRTRKVRTYDLVTPHTIGVTVLPIVVKNKKQLHVILHTLDGEVFDFSLDITENEDVTQNMTGQQMEDLYERLIRSVLKVFNANNQIVTLYDLQEAVRL